MAKQDILQGVYGVGEQLPVDQLADKYGTSKTPVGEALNLLQAEGLVEILPRVGYFTARFTLQEVQDLFEVRIILERAAARLAARRISQAQVALLENMQGTYTPGDRSTYLSWIQINREFHLRVAEASRNAELVRMIGHVVDRLQRVQWLRLDLPPTPEKAREGHILLIEALRHGDVEAAEAAVVENIVVSRDAALKKVAERPEEWPL